MYLRHTTVTRNGKSHTYWRVVRSVRLGHKVRQQTVAQLGELDAAGRVRARALAEATPGERDLRIPAQHMVSRNEMVAAFLAQRPEFWPQRDRLAEVMPELREFPVVTGLWEALKAGAGGAA
jgi:hypothetical protein